MNRKNQHGQALLMAIIFLLALTFLGFGLISVATMDINSSRNLRLSEEALSAAEEGALFALNYTPNNLASIMEAPSKTININSVTDGGKLNTDRLQYQVSIRIGARIEAPAGYGTNAIFNEVIVHSVGSVADTSGFIFSSSQSSMIQRRIEVLARVQTGVIK